MKLIKINYDDLNPRQQEAYNFQKAASVLADYGFNCIKLTDDWQGADFLAYHKDGNRTLKVQLKGRCFIVKKYIGQNLHMCFRINDTWFLVPHDRLIRIVEKRNPEVFKSLSWKKYGTRHWKTPPKWLQNKLNRYALEGERKR